MIYIVLDSDWKNKNDWIEILQINGIQLGRGV